MLPNIGRSKIRYQKETACRLTSIINLCAQIWPNFNSTAMLLLIRWWWRWH